MQGEELKTALEQDEAQRQARKVVSLPDIDAGMLKRRELGLPREATDAEVAAREAAMADVAKRAAAIRPAPAIDPATGQPPLRPDEAQQAIAGKVGAETITINSAALTIQMEQKTALVAKITACALAETARSLLAELNEPSEKLSEVNVLDPKTGKVVGKRTVQRHSLERMTKVMGVMNDLANLADKWDALGDKASARIPLSQVPEVRVQATDKDAQPEVTQPEAPPIASA